MKGNPNGTKLTSLKFSWSRRIKDAFFSSPNSKISHKQTNLEVSPFLLKWSISHLVSVSYVLFKLMHIACDVQMSFVTTRFLIGMLYSFSLLEFTSLIVLFWLFRLSIVCDFIFPWKVIFIAFWNSSFLFFQ